MGRVTLHHPDGRRVQADEAELDDPAKNPFNHGGPVVVADLDRGMSRSYNRPARVQDDHVSLLDEGFVIDGDILEEDRKDDDGNIVAYAGAEVARDPRLYRGDGLERASKPSDVGRQVAAKGLD